MPLEKKVTQLIPRIYKWNAENMALFWFIKGQMQLFPTIRLQQAMNNYRRFTGITVEDWDDESMRSTFNNMQKDFYKSMRTCNGNTTQAAE